MNKLSSAVKLVKSNRYNTYQFYGEMANKNTNPSDGLKYAILTTFKWLRERLKDSVIPEELLLPEKNEYRKVDASIFKSFNITDSFSINVVSCVEEGFWALRIIESDSGQLKENHEAVLGRTIQSDIAYRVVSNKLECGFKTTVYDTADVEKADCIRFALVKSLGLDPIFGFSTLINPKNTDEMEIESDQGFEKLKALINSTENQLPLIIYTDKATKTPEELLKEQTASIISINPKVMVLESLNSTTKDIGHMSNTLNKYYGIARAYLLYPSCFKKLASVINKVNIVSDEVIVVDAKRHGGKAKKYAHSDKSYSSYLYNYTRDKEYDFKDVLFVDEAAALITLKEEEKHSYHERKLIEKKEELDRLEKKALKQDRVSNYQVNNEENNNEELAKKIEQLETEKEVLIKENRRLTSQLQRSNAYNDYLERKIKWPIRHRDIADYCSDYEYVMLNNKAIDCLEANDATNVDVEVIMDALDYLEYAYAKYLFNLISEDELQDIANEIYQRPYNITPSGIPVSARSDCKIRYSFNGEKKREYPLDQHLKIGSHGEILRIYFIVDKPNRKIVIGSLPNHLEY